MLFVVTDDLIGESFLVQASSPEEACQKAKDSISPEQYRADYENLCRQFDRLNETTAEIRDRDIERAKNDPEWKPMNIPPPLEKPTFEEFMAEQEFEVYEQITFNNGVCRLSDTCLCL